MKSLSIRINAFPSLRDSTNFKLDELDKNRALLKSIKQKPKTEVYLAPSSDYEFYRTENWSSGGYIILENKKKNLISYIVKYERPEKIEGSIKPVVQTCVWKAIDWATSHLAEKVFFDILLKNCGVIMSDNEQTPEGKMFWQHMLSVAEHKGLTVAFIHKNRIVSIFDSKLDILDWINSFNTWGGPESKYKLDRFLISLNPIT
jgi:hypothetical protein